MYLLLTVCLFVLTLGGFFGCAWMNERRGNFTAWEGFAKVFAGLAAASFFFLMVQAAPLLLLLTATWIIIGLLLVVYGLLQFLR